MNGPIERPDAEPLGPNERIALLEAELAQVRKDFRRLALTVRHLTAEPES